MEQDTKVCRGCKSELPVENFYGKQGKCKECFKDRYREQQQQYRDENREVIRAKASEHYRENKDEINAYHRELYRTKYKDKCAARQKALPKTYIKNRYLKSRYGITLEDYEKMISEANSQCEICGQERSLVVDHCHATGKVRGILCYACNTALGTFHDDINKMQKAIDYLRSRGHSER